MENSYSIQEQVKIKIDKIQGYIDINLLKSTSAKKISEMTQVFNNHLDWKYNVTNWSEEDLMRIIENMLDGIIYFHETYSKRKSFALGNFNNIKNVVKGIDKNLFINKKSIYRFSDEVKNILEKYHRD